METDETQMQVDYLKLSELYASFLSALGGVSITVLALVLTLYPKPAEGNLSRFWVAALFVATISCFIGAHLMAEATAFISKSKKAELKREPKESKLGARLSLLASINIYVAAMLLIFTVVLLTAEHVKWVSVSVFLLVLIVTLSWMYHSANSRFNPIDLQAKKAIPCAIGIGVVVGILMFLAASRLFEEYFLLASFLVPLISIGSSFFYFVWILKFGDEERKLNVWFYSLAIALPCISLFGAGVGLVFR
jgi:hypothetical protein